MKKVKVGDWVVVVNKGELKAYEAKPRTLEAEAGLKEDEVKLELLSDKDYIATHKKLHEMLTDEAGRFKGDATKGASRGEEHNLEEEIEKRVLEDIAKDVNELEQKAPRKLFLALNEEIANFVLERINQDKIVKIVKKDLVKLPKEELLEKINKA